MSLIVYFWNNPASFLTALAATLIAYIIYKLFTPLLTRSKYPPGPVPLPLLGNVLDLRKKGPDAQIHFVDYWLKFSQKFGSIFTLYFGNVPTIIVTGPNEVKEACLKLTFAGRMDFGAVNELFFQKGSIDIFFADYSREWEVLRKVAHSAIRKFTVSVHLPPKVADTIKEVVQEMINREGINKSFDPNDYYYLMTHSVLAKAAYGVNFTMNDPDFKRLKRAIEVINSQTTEFFLIIMVPWLRFWYSSSWQKTKENSDFLNSYQYEQMTKHQKTFDSSQIRDFCDALLVAKAEAEAENSKDAKYLFISNLANVLSDIFLAGTDTTRMTLQWIFLILGNEPEVQERIIEEIESQIGDEIPTLEHKATCHFINSFLAEVLRFRPIAAFVIHKALEDTTLGGHEIPKDTVLLISLLTVNMDERTFHEPEKFIPDRFLRADGKFHESSLEASLPFGCQGRRTCPGNKFASANLFMLLVGFFQNIKGYRVELENGPGSRDYSVDPDNTSGYLPKNYKMKLVKAK